MAAEMRASIPTSIPTHLRSCGHDDAGREICCVGTQTPSVTPSGTRSRRDEELGRAGVGAQGADKAEALRRIPEQHGYEPHAGGDGTVLENCPFHTLARRHTELVCGMNLCLLDGLVDGLLAGLGETELSARLDPQPGHCCVRVEPSQEPPSR